MSTLIRQGVLLALAATLAPSLGAQEQFTPNQLFIQVQTDDQLYQVNVPSPGSAVFAPGLENLEKPNGGIAFGPDGLLYSASRVTDSVIAIGPDQTKRGEFSGGGSQLSTPQALAFGPKGRLHVGEATFTNDRIVVFELDGTFVGSIGDNLNLRGITGLAFGPDGHIFAVSQADDQVVELTPGGAVVRTIGAGDGSDIDMPRDITFGPDGLLYVASSVTNRIVVFDNAGDMVDEIGEDSELDNPTGVVFGPDARLYVTSTDTGVIFIYEDGVEVNQLTFDDLTLTGTKPRSMAFAPWRFNASMKGLHTRPDISSKNRKAKGVLSVAPGSGTLMLAFEDDPADDDDLPSILGSPYVVLHGFDASVDASDKKHNLSALQVLPGASQSGIAAISLTANGKVLKGDATGQEIFTVKKNSGTFSVASADGVYTAKFKAGKLLK